MTDIIEEIRARHEAFPDDRSQAVSDRATLLRALDAMVEENAALNAVFVAQWGADMRAKQRWQIATGKEGTWPDRANLVVWLLEQVEKLEAALDAALAEENARLREALRPFTLLAENLESLKNSPDTEIWTYAFYAGDIRRARAALKKTGQ